MPSWKPVAATVAMLATAAFSAPANAEPVEKAVVEGPVYTVSLLRMRLDGERGDRQFRRYLAKSERLLKRAGGRFLTAPIEVDPAIAGETLDYDYITIAELPSESRLKRYLRGAKAFHITQSKNFAAESRFVAAVTEHPWIENAPLLGSIEHRPAPAFILVHALSLHEDAEPVLDRYFEGAANTDTRHLAVFAHMETLRGEYPHDYLVLSEFASEQALSAQRDNPDWSAVETQALSSFEQTGGRLLAGQKSP